MFLGHGYPPSIVNDHLNLLKDTWIDCRRAEHAAIERACDAGRHDVLARQEQAGHRRTGFERFGQNPARRRFDAIEPALLVARERAVARGVPSS